MSDAVPPAAPAESAAPPVAHIAHVAHVAHVLATAADSSWPERERRHRISLRITTKDSPRMRAYLKAPHRRGMQSVMQKANQTYFAEPAPATVLPV